MVVREKKVFSVVVSAGATGPMLSPPWKKTLYVLTGVYQTIVLQAAQAQFHAYDGQKPGFENVSMGRPYYMIPYHISI